MKHWTGCQSIMGLTQRDRESFTLAFTAVVNSEPSAILTHMSLDSGRKPEYPESTHIGTGRTFKQK